MLPLCLLLISLSLRHPNLLLLPDQRDPRIIMALSIALAALAGATIVSAHGYVITINAGGQEYKGYNPSIAEWEPDQVCTAKEHHTC